jgi:hypothetical protein
MQCAGKPSSRRMSQKSTMTFSGTKDSFALRLMHLSRLAELVSYLHHCMKSAKQTQASREITAIKGKLCMQYSALGIGILEE